MPRSGPACAFVRVPDGHAGVTSDAAEALPSWDLTDLYPAPDSPEVADGFAQADAAARAFNGAYAGRLATLSGAQLAAALAEYERIGDEEEIPF